MNVLARKNCWEVMKCGRQPGGKKVGELGVCPASINSESDCFNGGKNAGRYCWAITGTLCHGKVRGTYAEKFGNCLKCKFLNQVSEEEGRYFGL